MINVFIVAMRWNTLLSGQHYYVKRENIANFNYLRKIYITGVSFLQMEYIRTQSKPRDGKLLTIGHSMGGILLYAMLSLYGMQVFFLLLFLS